MKDDIAEIVSLAEKHAALDYADERAPGISSDLSKKIRDRLSLLDETDLSHCLEVASLREWATYFILEQPRVTDVMRAKCIRVLEKIAQGDSQEALAAKWKLDELANDT